MKKGWQLSKEAFERLLVWLDPDREEAGKRYEEIRHKLITIFVSRGCPNPEELADETFNRATAKLPEIAPGYVGDKALYLYGIAKLVAREASQPKPKPPPSPFPEDADERERRHRCLDQCLAKLDEDQRQAVLEYYSRDGSAKIKLRKAMAVRLGLTDNALKIRMHRLREKLHRCVLECLKR